MLPVVIERYLAHDVVRHQGGLEGMSIAEDGVILLGSRCGPVAFDLNALLHEMCHLVEIDDRRVTVYGWGLTYTEVEILGRAYQEPSTCQDVRRELRVLAYQTNLRQALELSPSVEETVRSLVHLPGWCFVPGPGPAKARHAWCMKRLESLSRKHSYSFESFDKEWWRKIALLRAIKNSGDSPITNQRHV